MRIEPAPVDDDSGTAIPRRYGKIPAKNLIDAQNRSRPQAKRS